MKISMSCPVKKIEDTPTPTTQTMLKRKSSIREFSASLRHTSTSRSQSRTMTNPDLYASTYKKLRPFDLSAEDVNFKPDRSMD